jgi:hypothetical protein
VVEADESDRLSCLGVSKVKPKPLMIDFRLSLVGSSFCEFIENTSKIISKDKHIVSFFLRLSNLLSTSQQEKGVRFQG